MRVGVRDWPLAAGPGSGRATPRGRVMEFGIGWLAAGLSSQKLTPAGAQIILKGLILAQNERWRRGLGMQVAGIPGQPGGTGVRGSKAWVPTPGSGIARREAG